MAEELFTPLGSAILSTGMLICNCNTGELLEVIYADGHQVKMKSCSTKSITITLISQLEPKDWVICNVS